jgi:hypothetical protein
VAPIRSRRGAAGQMRRKRNDEKERVPRRDEVKEEKEKVG